MPRHPHAKVLYFSIGEPSAPEFLQKSLGFGEHGLPHFQETGSWTHKTFDYHVTAQYLDLAKDDWLGHDSHANAIMISFPTEGQNMAELEARFDAVEERLQPAQKELPVFLVGVGKEVPEMNFHDIEIGTYFNAEQAEAILEGINTCSIKHHDEPTVEKSVEPSVDA